MKKKLNLPFNLEDLKNGRKLQGKYEKFFYPIVGTRTKILTENISSTLQKICKVMLFASTFLIANLAINISASHPVVEFLRKGLKTPS